MNVKCLTIKPNKGLLLFCLFLLIFNMNCVQPPVPVDGIDKEAMTIEYDYIPGFDVGSDSKALPEIDTNVANAFEDVGTEFLPDRDENNPLPFWVPGDPDSQFPDQNDRQLRDYARDQRHALNGKLKKYHFLSVNYANFNYQQLALLTLGKSIESPIHQSPTPEDERYSYVFWGDIFENQFMTQLTEQQMREHAVEVSTHELGHQRVQLTHWEVAQYHNNPGQPDCVMRAGIDDVGLFYQLNPFFCFDNDGDDTNSCKDWLRKANP